MERAALQRMASTLGEHAVFDVLNAEASQHSARIAAFIQMEEMLVQRGREEAKHAAEMHASTTLERVQQEMDDLSAAKHAAEQTIHELSRSLDAANTHATAMQSLSYVASNNRGTKPIKLDVPPYFGKEGENLRHWLIAVQTAMKAGLVDNEMSVPFAVSHLRGRAKDWAYSLLMADANAFPSFDAFKHSLFDAFQPPNDDFRLRARFLTCRQGKRSLHEYVQELRYLNAALNEPLSESTKVTIFMEGLQQGPARLQLFRSTPHSMEDAFRIAFTEEHSHKVAQRGAAAVVAKNVTMAQTNQAPTPMELGSVSTITCYNCGRKGHMQRQCRLPKKKDGNKFNAQRARDFKRRVSIPTNRGNGNRQENGTPQ